MEMLLAAVLAFTFTVSVGAGYLIHRYRQRKWLMRRTNQL